jgi:phage shock protein C
MSPIEIENTVKISDQELQSTLHEFLEENETKSKESIWNIRTLAGLGFVFTAFAYIGHSIATEVFGLQALPFVYTLMKVVPYLAGAFLGVTVLSMFKSPGEKKREKEKVMEEKERIRETYDKLDEFLYTEKMGKRSSRKERAKTIDTFEVSSTQKLFRSRTDNYISGVCGGLAKYLGISSTVIRLIFLAGMFLGWGTLVLVYIAMAIVMPKEPVSLMDDFN